ncbi:MAG TPA: hypothetical protein VIO11_02590, partial [Candidatus Methanoperedens sp.]
MNLKLRYIVIVSIVIAIVFAFFYVSILNQKLDANVVVAAANMILAIITFWYAIFSYSMLGEQRKSRQIEAIEKRLEKVYSPMDEAITEFDLEADQVIQLEGGDPLSRDIKNAFEGLTKNLLIVKREYGHLIDFNVVQSHNDLWKFYIAHRHNTLSQAEIDTLRGLINVFHRHIGVKISEYKKQLEDLQEIRPGKPAANQGAN